MVTRPEHFADALCEAIAKAGGEAVRFPTIHIVDIADNPRTISLFENLDRFSALIFVSRNAVLCACGLLHRIGVTLPQKNIIAIGAKTAQQLSQEGVHGAVYSRAMPSTESLIESGLLKEIGRGEVLIVRGQGGREVLAEYLREQGARVTYAEVYRREKPQAKLSFDKEMPPDVILTSSAESLQNLYRMIDKASRPQLLKVQVIVGSHNMVVAHKELGFHIPPVIADSPTDEDMWKAVLTWRKNYA